MTSSIPASAIVSVLPSVIDAGGSGLDLVGLILTDSVRVPTGTVVSFSTASDVAAYFGPISTEATMAATYFAGYDGSTIKPAKGLFYRYVAAAAPAFLRSHALARTLASVQALSGTIIVSVGGTVKTSGTINLSAATSFSDAAAIIQAGFSTPGFTVSYDAQADAFLFTTTATGNAATLTYATGTLSGPLGLTSALGATLSAGADVTTPAACMDAVTALTQNFVTFTTTFAPSSANKVAFAGWANGKGDRFAYLLWETDGQAAVSNDTTLATALIAAAGYSGTVPIFDPNAGPNIAAWAAGSIASIDFARENGRPTLAFRTGTIEAGVTNQTVAANLKANGYNFVGSYATAGDQFVFFYPGQISGKFDWIDSWVCQVWMNNAFQLALMGLLTNIGQIPYNQDGFGMIEASLRSVVDDALNFGAIRAGVSLSAQQKAEVNNRAGGNVADAIERRGWFISVKDPGASVRANRGSPVTTVFYTDGQSVQTITLSSVNVQ